MDGPLRDEREAAGLPEIYTRSPRNSAESCHSSGSPSPSPRFHQRVPPAGLTADGGFAPGGGRDYQSPPDLDEEVNFRTT